MFMRRAANKMWHTCSGCIPKSCENKNKLSTHPSDTAVGNNLSAAINLYLGPFAVGKGFSSPRGWGQRGGKLFWQNSLRSLHLAPDISWAEN